MQITGMPVGSGLLTKALSAVVARAKIEFSIPWSTAVQAILAATPQIAANEILEQLIHFDLLIEDGSSSLIPETFVRPAFERLSDYLIADSILSKFKTDDQSLIAELNHLAKDGESINLNSGILSALSVLIPEKWPGVELVNLASPSVRTPLLMITFEALSARNPAALTEIIRNIVLESLSVNSVVRTMAIDAVLSIATQESCIDSTWFDTLLQKQELAKRDEYWCPYLQNSYNSSDVVWQLISAKHINIKSLYKSTAERWLIVLLWFTASSDRRVKDCSSRAIVAILEIHHDLIMPLMKRFLYCNDDEVCERLLLCIYGSLINSSNESAIKEVGVYLLSEYQGNSSRLQNVLIRDNIRCIADLASVLGLLGELDPLLPTKKRFSEWTLVPTEEKVLHTWSNEHRFYNLIGSCLNGDFNHYSIHCIMYWWSGDVTKTKCGEWILSRIINDLGYGTSDCWRYDEDKGKGRGGPQWDERIGKKYQWIGLYQLASRLHDNLKRDKLSPKGRKPPLILQDERKLDPTLPTGISEQSLSDGWWVQSKVDLGSTDQVDLPAWVHLKSDLPDLKTVLKPIVRGKQTWRLLVSNETWSDFKPNRPRDQVDRYAWYHLRSFLIPKRQFSSALEALAGRNLFGDWMPKGANWLHSCFVGEYPWGVAYDPSLDWWHGWSDRIEGSKLKFIPSYNQISCEWQYDGALTRNLYVHVPSRPFFKKHKLRWNGIDGFMDVNAKTIFRDPHIAEDGTQALLVDNDRLPELLDQLGYRLIWTFLGEKTLLNSRHRGIVYSQIAHLNKDGSATIGDRIYFEDLESNQGLAPGWR